ncbi:MAG: aspartate aminotransferase family protein [Candidatus Methylopumilus sp.]|jgi:acetylornithine aminotransferase|nr:aspartate aminotransferase family protein [Betaproteobacteria bacterium]
MSKMMDTYARQPVTFEKGEGIWLWAKDGKKYLDALSGVAVNGLGHKHPKLIKAINEQISRLIHVSNVYHIAEQERLAEKLTAISHMDNVFFCNSGCEANEAAIKLARLFGHQKGIDTPEIIVMEKAFHGRTMATLSATGNRKTQAGFEPLVGGFIRVAFDDLEAIQQIASRKNNVVAILVEPIQGEGGINIPSNIQNYLKGLRAVCDEHNWLLMLDEVQSGIGRTGKWFAHQHTSVQPDVMTLAKGLGSGIPIGACLAKGKASKVFTPGKHGSTFGGNPLATSAGYATLTIIEEDKLCSHASKMGALINKEFTKHLKDYPQVKVIRNLGLMIGIELDHPCGDLTKLALNEGLLINVTAEKVIRLLPPLVINDMEAKELAERLSQVIKNFLAK